MSEKTWKHSDSKSTIIRLLQKNESMTFTELKKELGLTDTTVSKHLSKLVDEQSIEFTKEGRHKHYRIGKKASEITKRKTTLFSSELFDVLPESEKYDDPKLFFQELSETLFTMWYFSIFKSMESGENLIDSLNMKELSRDSITRISDMIHQGKNDDEFKEILYLQDLDFKKMKDYIKKDKEIGKNFEIVKTIFKNMSKQKYDEVNEIYNKI